jgi:hypothetical protein
MPSTGGTIYLPLQRITVVIVKRRENGPDAQVEQAKESGYPAQSYLR